MISKVFVDRPRLAIVIAVVTVIAGAISLLQIPVAQFPDIVPPARPMPDVGVWRECLRGCGRNRGAVASPP